LALSVPPAFAGELSLLGGHGWTTQPREKTYAYQIQYMEGLGEHFAYSLAYFNQGHFIEHHRDADVFTLWVRQNLLNRHLSLALGGGGLFYYDTIHPGGGPGNQDFHGWGTVASVSATWYTDSRWFGQVQGNWVRGGQSFDTLTALAGVGYQLDPPAAPGPSVKGTHQGENTTENEITLYGGQSVVNITGPGHAVAVALEYRRGIWRYLEWTARALYEGKSDLMDRYGITSQLWLAKEFFDDRLALGAGLGGYLARDRRGGTQTNRSADFFLAEVASVTAAYRFTPHWALRATWDRTITTYNRDTDIFLGGIGYRF